MDKITSISSIITVGLILYWLGPTIVNWMTSHMFVTTYQRTLHKKDLE